MISPNGFDFRLEPSRKAQWLAALRSGDYKQGQCCLRSNTDKYCCLGVYASLQVSPEAWIPGRRDRAEFCISFPQSESKHAYFLPDSILPRFVQKPLSEMNDEGKTFAEIADWIEENL